MKKLLITLMALVPFIANAGFYAEPYLGYGMGDYDNGTTTFDEAGTVMGARIGGSFMGLIGGFEYSKESFEVDFATSLDVDITDMGVFAGYQFPSIVPFLGKVWGSYYFDSEAKTDSSKVEGSGYALGLGLAPIPVPLPFVSVHLNLEYRVHDWKDDGATDSDSQYIFSISLPINI